MNNPASARLHLVLGPVGAGKSTHALRLQLAHRAVRLNLDEWMARLYGDDPRPEGDRMGWYVARTERCMALIWALTGQLIDAGTAVVLEIGLIRRADRQAFYEQVDAAGYDLVVHLVDAPRDVRRARVLKRNEERGHTWAMDVPLPFFEVASDLWEPPDDRECSERDIS